MIDSEGRLVVAGSIGDGLSNDTTHIYSVTARYLLDGPPSTELIVNSSFEEGTAEEITGWKAKNLSNDKRFCDAPDAEKVKAFRDSCTMIFKGTHGENVKLKQKIASDTVAPDDILTLSAWAGGKKVEGVITLSIKYTDGSKDKITLTLKPKNAGYDRFIKKPYVVKSQVTKITAQFQFTQPSGTLMLDDVSLRVESPAERLPLPIAAP